MEIKVAVNAHLNKSASDLLLYKYQFICNCQPRAYKPDSVLSLTIFIDSRELKISRIIKNGEGRDNHLSSPDVAVGIERLPCRPRAAGCRLAPGRVYQGTIVANRLES